MKPVEYTLFLNYTDKIKEFLIKNSYLKKYPKEENVQVFFATPPMAFAKFLIPVINGANLNPTISFYLNGIEYLQNENLLGYVEKPIRISETGFLYLKPHLIYKLIYKVNILTTIEREADILQYQLLTKAPFNRPYPFKIMNNEWGTVYSQSASIDTELIPGEAKDKIISRSLELIIPRAYLPVECEIHDGIIEEINIVYDTSNGSSI